MLHSRRLLIALAAALLLFPIRAHGQDSAPAAQPQPAPAATPWFVNVADQMGIAAQVSLRTKLIDFNNDGWPDALCTGNGAAWRDAFQARNHLPEGLPKVGDTRQIAKADWPGEAADFDLIDFDHDGTLTQDEYSLAVKMNNLSLWLSVPADGGGRKFVNVTGPSGIRRNHEGTARGRETNVTVAGDIDNDGDIDLFSGSYVDGDNPANKVPDVGDRSCVLLNDGTATFSIYRQPAPEKAGQPVGPNQQPSTVCAATLADVNNDGRLDLFTGSWYSAYGRSYDAHPDRLYYGLAQAAFQDATQAAGMMLQASPFDVLTAEEQRSGTVSEEKKQAIGRKSHRPTYGVTAADADGDGDDDLFVMAYGRQWNCQWRNNGDGTFTEIAEQTGFDGDSNRTGAYEEWVKEMFRQRGGERADELPFRSNGNTFTCAFADYNNDGNLDAVLGEITHAWAGPSSDRSQVLTNLGKDGAFKWRHESPLSREHANPRGWNQGDMHAAFADIDNDGWADVILSSSDYPDEQRLRIFRQDPATHTFNDITAEIGLDWAYTTQFSLADVDRDGDLDILIGNTHTRLPAELREKYPLGSAVLRNDICNRNGTHFLSLKLKGAGPEQDGANRAAIGARIIVTAGGVTQTREIFGGGGHVGQQHDFRQIIGLGQAGTIDRLEIRWGGKAKRVTVLENVKADQFLRISEADGKLQPDQPKATQEPEDSDQF